LTLLDNLRSLEVHFDESWQKRSSGAKIISTALLCVCANARKKVISKLRTSGRTVGSVTSLARRRSEPAILTLLDNLRSLEVHFDESWQKRSSGAKIISTAEAWHWSGERSDGEIVDGLWEWDFGFDELAEAELFEALLEYLTVRRVKTLHLGVLLNHETFFGALPWADLTKISEAWHWSGERSDGEIVDGLWEWDFGFDELAEAEHREPPTSRRVQLLRARRSQSPIPTARQQSPHPIVVKYSSKAPLRLGIGAVNDRMGRLLTGCGNGTLASS
jgi:hypothetical protein